jgi:hypothetical protein
VGTVRPTLIWPLVIIVPLAIAWSLAGRPLTLFLDRFTKVRTSSFPVTAIVYDGGGFRIGEERLTFCGLDNLRRDIRLQTDASNRVILSTEGCSFTLGPRTAEKEPPGSPRIAFAPEPGDEVSLTIDRSLLSWPAYRLKIMGPPPSWWRRNFYYRLTWKKQSRASLDMLWRYEQRYFAQNGWDKPVMRFDYSSGLIRVDVQVDPSAHEAAVVQYLARAKNWKRTQYRIEARGPSADQTTDRVAVIFLEDESSPHPGGGQSVELYVDRASGQVTKELGSQ